MFSVCLSFEGTFTKKQLVVNKLSLSLMWVSSGTVENCAKPRNQWKFGLGSYLFFLERDLVGTNRTKFASQCSDCNKLLVFPPPQFFPVHQFQLIPVVMSHEHTHTHTLIGHAFPLYLDVLSCLPFFPALPPLLIFPPVLACVFTTAPFMLLSVTCSCLIKPQ